MLYFPSHLGACMKAIVYYSFSNFHSFCSEGVSSLVRTIDVALPCLVAVGFKNFKKM